MLRGREKHPFRATEIKSYVTLCASDFDKRHYWNTRLLPRYTHPDNSNTCTPSLCRQNCIVMVPTRLSGSMKHVILAVWRTELAIEAWNVGQ